MSSCKITGIILASGLSKRYGCDNKLMADYRGKPLISHVLERVSGSHYFDEIIVVSPYTEVRAVCSRYDGVQVLDNKDASLGISHSIKLGVMASHYLAQGYMFIPGDQPLLSCETFMELIESFKTNPSSIIVPVYKGSHGSPKIFSSSFREALLALQGDVGGKQLIEDYRSDVVEVIIHRAYENRDIDSKADHVGLEKELG